MKIAAIDPASITAPQSKNTAFIPMNWESAPPKAALRATADKRNIDASPSDSPVPPKDMSDF